MESINNGSHISDELLAEYALGRLPTRDAPAVFEHLLVCDECNRRYEAELAFKNDLREAIARPAAAELPERKRGWLNLFGLPKPAWAAVVALVLVAAFLPVLQRPAGPAQIVELSAVRGAEALAA